MAEYATLVDRAVAVIIDSIIAGIITMAISIPLFGFTMLSMTAMADPTAIFGSMMGMYGTVFIVWLLYYTYFEGTSGQTPGKKMMKIKVVREDNKPMEFSVALIRNILRFIDAMPTLYILGIILIAATEKKQRLGDIVAKTLVVKA